MAQYRLPGPTCSWGQSLLTDDGTLALQPGCLPGPIDGVVSGHASNLDPRTLWRRAEAVREACAIGLVRAPTAIVRETGLDDLPGLVRGILDGMLGMLAVVAATSVIGGAAGGAIGFFAGGVGAVPGAAIGAGLGMDAGVAVLSWLGLAFLAVAIVRALAEVSGMVTRAVGQAWHAEGTAWRRQEIDTAGQLLADAVGRLMLAIIMAVVARLAATQAMASTERAAASAEELYAALRKSRLGAGFADWVRANAQRLLDNPRLRMHNEVRGSGAKGGGAVTPSQLRRQVVTDQVNTSQMVQPVPRSAPQPPMVNRAVPAGENPFDYYMQQARRLDVATPRHAAVFYSGPGNRALAEQFAASNGRSTLEMTRGGSWLDQQRLFAPDSPLTPAQAVEVWETLSTRFAQQAGGNAVGFVQGARPNGIFHTVELPTLMSNPNITNVLTGGH